MIVRSSTFIDAAPERSVSTAPLKDPRVTSWALMVWPPPSTVCPSGTESGAVVSQSAVSVKVLPLRLPAQAVSMVGSPGVALALTENMTGAATAKIKRTANASDARSRVIPTPPLGPPALPRLSASAPLWKGNRSAMRLLHTSHSTTFHRVLRLAGCQAVRPAGNPAKGFLPPIARDERAQTSRRSPTVGSEPVPGHLPPRPGEPDLIEAFAVLRTACRLTLITLTATSTTAR